MDRLRAPRRDVEMKWASLRARVARGPARPGAPAATYRPDFVDFLTSSKGVDRNVAAAAVDDAEGLFDRGWGGSDYRDFTTRALEALRPLHGDSTVGDVIRTYQVHAPFDFLRMLSYGIPTDAELEPIVGHLRQRGAEVAIVDYGCGLAHRTIAVARALTRQGTRVRLTFVDVRRDLHVSFLSFLSLKYQLDHEFIDVTENRLYPALPTHDYADVVNVLEHVREPLQVVANIDRSLRRGGLLLAGVADQEAEMMHITPDLASVRVRLAELGYLARWQRWDATLFEKPA